MTESDLKTICNVIPCEDAGDVDDQAHSIMLALTGVSVSYDIQSGGEQPDVFPPTYSASNNIVTFSRNSNNGGFDITTVGSIDNETVTSPYIIKPTDDGKTFKLTTSGTNFKTLINSITLSYTQPITGSTWNITINGYPNNSEYSGEYDYIIVWVASYSSGSSSYGIDKPCNILSNGFLAGPGTAYPIALYKIGFNEVTFAPSLTIVWRSQANGTVKCRSGLKDWFSVRPNRVGSQYSSWQTILDSVTNGAPLSSSITTIAYDNGFSNNIDGTTVGSISSTEFPSVNIPLIASFSSAGSGYPNSGYYNLKTNEQSAVNLFQYTTATQGYVYFNVSMVLTFN